MWSVAGIDQFIWALFPAKNIKQTKLVHGFKNHSCEASKFWTESIKQLQLFQWKRLLSLSCCYCSTTLSGTLVTGIFLVRKWKGEKRLRLSIKRRPIIDYTDFQAAKRNFLPPNSTLLPPIHISSPCIVCFTPSYFSNHFSSFWSCQRIHYTCIISSGKIVIVK